MCSKYITNNLERFRIVSKISHQLLIAYQYCIIENIGSEKLFVLQKRFLILFVLNHKLSDSCYYIQIIFYFKSNESCTLLEIFT